MSESEMSELRLFEDNFHSWLEDNGAELYGLTSNGTFTGDLDLNELKPAIMRLVGKYTTKAVREAKIEVIDYVLREPTGALIMTSKEMNATPDSEWRNQVIQYFFNTDSLRFNLERMKETLEKEALPSKTNGA